MQLIIRAYFGGRISIRIKKDKSTTKRNQGSRKGCSIEITLSEKLLIFVHAMKNEKIEAHAELHLEAFYDR